MIDEKGIDRMCYFICPPGTKRSRSPPTPPVAEPSLDLSEDLCRLLYAGCRRRTRLSQSRKLLEGL